MALTERIYGYPKTIETADYQKQNALIAGRLKDSGKLYNIDIENDVILKGSFIHFGGIALEAESDESITGIKSRFVKINISDYTAEYVDSIDDAEWNAAYAGYYDSTGNLYLISEASKIENLSIPIPYKKGVHDLMVAIQATTENNVFPIMPHYFPDGNPSGQLETAGNLCSVGDNLNQIAFIIDEGTNAFYLYTLEFDIENQSWEIIGNPYDFENESLFIRIAQMENNRIAVSTGSSTSQTYKLRMLEFDGTDWSVVGNITTVETSVTAIYPSISSLNSNTVAFASDYSNELRVYEFDESDWIQVGNDYSLDSDRYGIATIGFNQVVLYYDNNIKLKAFRFNGSDWEPVGNEYTLNFAISLPEIISFNDLIIIDYPFAAKYYVFKFDGSDFIYNSMPLIMWLKELDSYFTANKMFANIDNKYLVIDHLGRQSIDLSIPYEVMGRE